MKRWEQSTAIFGFTQRFNPLRSKSLSSVDSGKYAVKQVTNLTIRNLDTDVYRHKLLEHIPCYAHPRFSGVTLKEDDCSFVMEAEYRSDWDNFHVIVRNASETHLLLSVFFVTPALYMLRPVRVLPPSIFTYFTETLFDKIIKESRVPRKATVHAFGDTRWAPNLEFSRIGNRKEYQEIELYQEKYQCPIFKRMIETYPGAEL